MKRTAVATGLLIASLALTACVHSTITTVDRTTTTIQTVSPSAAPTGPIDARPVVASDADSCPYLSRDAAMQDGGMRLARIQVLRQGSTVVGCRFYAIQGSSLAISEHLPGPNQPVIEITSARYADATAAHNALARLSAKGTEQGQYPVATGVVGVAYRASFDPQDGARDWAFAFAKKTKLIVVRTVSDKTSQNALIIAQAIVGEF